MKGFLASAAVAAVVAASGAADARTYTYNISDFYPSVAAPAGAPSSLVTGAVILDVTGSQVTGGTATLRGSLLGSGTIGFSLVTVDNYCGGTCTGWRSGNGDDWFGGDTSFPIDMNGLVFASSSTWNAGYVFGLYSNGSGGFQGALFGNGHTNEFWGYNEGLTLTAIPEPATWAMLAVGFAALGFAGYRKARTPRAVDF